MKDKSWALALGLAIVSRLVVTNGGPLRTAKVRQNFAGNSEGEEEIEHLYELLQKEQRKTRSSNAASRILQTATKSSDSGSSSKPKFHFEVHRVLHRFGHLTPADEKLKAVARQAEHPSISHLARKSGLQSHKVPTSKSAETDQAMPERIQGYNHPADHETSYEKKEEGIPNEVKTEGGPEKDRSKDKDEEQGHRNKFGGRNLEERNPVALGLASDRRSGGQTDSKPSAIADVYFIAVVAGCAVAGLVGLLLAAVCWYRLHTKIKATSEVDYPAYGVTGPSVSASSKGDGGGRNATGSPGDRKLAQSAQMYHYQHQKQQMIAASERVSQNVTNQHIGGSDVESEEENEEGDYTVFECPGLATNGEMEVRNPLFTDQTTPVTTPGDSSIPPPQTKK